MRRSFVDDRRQNKEREWYHRHDYHDRDTPQRSSNSRLEYNSVDRHHRAYRRSTSPSRPPRQCAILASDMLHESSSKRHDTRGLSRVVTVKQEGESSLGSKKKMFSSSLTLKKESVPRSEPREKELDRELDIREDAGVKQNYVHVNEDGKPYGLGITAWNDALGKVVRGLDTSYIDIRHQPWNLMDVLMNKINEDFKYSEYVNLN